MNLVLHYGIRYVNVCNACLTSVSHDFAAFCANFSCTVHASRVANVIFRTVGATRKVRYVKFGINEWPLH